MQAGRCAKWRAPGGVVVKKQQVLCNGQVKKTRREKSWRETIRHSASLIQHALHAQQHPTDPLPSQCVGSSIWSAFPPASAFVGVVCQQACYSGTPVECCSPWPRSQHTTPDTRARARARRNFGARAHPFVRHGLDKAKLQTALVLHNFCRASKTSALLPVYPTA